MNQEQMQSVLTRASESLQAAGVDLTNRGAEVRVDDYGYWRIRTMSKKVVAALLVEFEAAGVEVDVMLPEETWHKMFVLTVAAELN